MAEYLRGRIWWISYAGPTGKTIFESTKQNDRRVAERIYRERKRAVATGTWERRAHSGRVVTVSDFAERWIRVMHDRGIRTAHDYEVRMRRHILPKLGEHAFADLRPKVVTAFVESLNAAMRDGKIAARTVHHIYQTLHLMCRYAVQDEVIAANPCVLLPGVLPKKRDKDPSWRARAVFTRAEAEILISDPTVPHDRRVLYALLLLTGMRFGEAAGRRWEDLDTTARPLGRLVVATQYDGRKLKTEQPREVPLHRTLSAVLAEWRLSGFPQFFARTAKPTDLIIPSRLGRIRSVRHAHRRLQEDLGRLELRARRVHDTRRTFISLARIDGARSDVLQLVTHGPTGAVIDQYTSFTWPTLCESVMSLQLKRRGARANGLPARARLDDRLDRANAKTAKKP